MSQRASVRKLGPPDHRETWGDCGGADIYYPVWWQHINKEEPPQRLAATLRAIDDERGDVQPNGIVHDIIDPSLHCHVLLPEKYHEYLLTRQCGVSSLDYPNGHAYIIYLHPTRLPSIAYRYNYGNGKYERLEWIQQESRWVVRARCGEQRLGCFDSRKRKNIHSDFSCPPWTVIPDEAHRQMSYRLRGIHLSEEERDVELELDRLHDITLGRRGAFRWLPVPVEVDFEKQSATFTGPIAGLPPRQCCPSLYTDLEQLLSSMLSLLQEVPIDPEQKTYDHNKKEWVNAPVSIADYLHSQMKGQEAKREQPLPVLQVVVKAQRYVIPPHSTYTGRWHTEGIDAENIVAAAVHYLHVSNKQKGGTLAFRPKVTPTQYYFERKVAAPIPFKRNCRESWDEPVLLNAGDKKFRAYWQSANERPDVLPRDKEKMYRYFPKIKKMEEVDFWNNYICEIPVQTGTSVAFSNSIPHRFQSIHNETDKQQERFFVNFFIVDPRKPQMNTTVNTPTPSLLRSLFAHPNLQVEGGTLPNETRHLIVEHALGTTAASLLGRKILRDRAREAMSVDRPHWQVQEFGNAGAVAYHGDRRRCHGGGGDDPNHPLRPPPAAMSRAERCNYGGQYDQLEHSGCPTSQLGSGL